MTVHDRDPNSEIRFCTLYEKFHKSIYQTTYYVTRDEQIARDAMQETFLKAFTHMDKLRNKETVRSWLLVIATNTAVDLLQKQRKNLSTPIDPEMLNFLNNGYWDQDIENYTTKQTIMEAMKQLIPEYKEVIRLKYFEDLKEEEIAESLEVSKGTVKSRLYRAKRKMREIIESNP